LGLDALITIRWEAFLKPVVEKANALALNWKSGRVELGEWVKFPTKEPSRVKLAVVIAVIFELEAWLTRMKKI
jgi:hypothetical protein